MPTITLHDGRTLGYREYGDAAGTPVVNCHGGLVCGLDVAPFHDAATSLGLRLLSPDRPGLGESTPSPGRATVDWATDVAALLDATGIDRAHVFGWSMGGQYALACAALLPSRVDRAVVVAGALPLDDDTTFGALNHMDRRLTRLAQHHPHVAGDIFRALGELARHRPEAWAHLTTRGAVPAEGSALESLPDPGIAAAAASALEGGDGMVEEYVAWARPWGFPLERVTSPVIVHQGSADELIPAAWGEELARRIPDSHFVRHEDAGHFLVYPDPARVLREFVD